MKKLAVILILLVSYAFAAIPQNELQQKFHKAIKGTYEIENFDLTEIKVTAEIAAQANVEMNEGNLFKIKKQDKLIGYAYLGTAPSKKKEFEYVVLFDKNFIIKKSKVLIYRENYGLQIGTQRWLKQFIGMSPKDEIVYGENIAAISGATISASSMARAVNKVLQTVDLLQQKEIL